MAQTETAIPQKDDFKFGENEIKDTIELKECLSNAEENLIVINFSYKGIPPCERINPKFDEYANS